VSPRLQPIFLPPAAVASLAVLCACGDAARPGVRTAANVAGEYVLTHRDGKPLPHTMRFTRDGRACTSILVREVLTLRADGTWVDEYESRGSCGDTPPPDTTSIVYTAGRFELRGLRGDSITLTDTVQVGESQTGVVAGDEVRTEFHAARGRSIMRFRYVRQGS
jgi:hypothetical protein